jgi:apolipoprotein D and lipocalin family protein
MKILFLISMFPVLIGFAAAQPENELPVVNQVDLNRYLGKWYEIATIPQRFQKGCHCVTAEYSLRKNGKIKVVNSCRKDHPDGPFKQAIGRAKVVRGSNNAKLKVSFFGPFWGNYWIIALDQQDYQWAVVSDPSRKTLWILCRTPQMDGALYQQIVEHCHTVRINTDLLQKTDQSCYY